MIKSLTRARLLALFGATIFAAASMAPPPASADWVGEIDPDDKQSLAWAQASGFADENGRIHIPTPAQVGDVEKNVIFRGSGAILVLVTDMPDQDIQIGQETPPETSLRLTIETGRHSDATAYHSIALQRVDRTGEMMGDLLTVNISGTDGVSAFVKLTGSFDCSGTICDGPQNGKLSFSLKVLAPPE